MKVIAKIKVMTTRSFIFSRYEIEALLFVREYQIRTKEIVGKYNTSLKLKQYRRKLKLRSHTLEITVGNCKVV